MPLSDEVHSRIEETIASNKVVLFMKGTPEQPQCGFSATVTSILNNLTPDYKTVNVLEDPEVREGIKTYSEWPTIPQLYIDGEFVGGCDVIQKMYADGELHLSLGLDPVEPVQPKISLSDAAAASVNAVVTENPGVAVHLKIDANWNHQFGLAPAKGHEIKAMANGIEILLDLDSARRADGLVIDMVDSSDGTGFSINNPNAPPSADQMPVEDLKSQLDAGEDVHLFDVRELEERERASIEGARFLDESAIEFIESLSKESILVFHCHSGVRSQAAADFFRRQGYEHSYNLSGGIDAWSLRVDASVPRY